jgi:molybdopterin converting factor small subunit
VGQRVLNVEVRYYAAALLVTIARTEDVAMPPGSTLRDLLLILAANHGGDLHGYIFDAEGNPTDFLTYLVNGSDIHVLEGFNTKLADGDAIAMFPRTHPRVTN